MFCGTQNLSCSLLIHIGLLKKSQTNFGGEYGTHCLINGSGRESPLLDQPRKVSCIRAAAHIHIYTCCQSAKRSIAGVAGKTMCGEIFHCKSITDNKATKIPVMPENILKQEAVTGSRNIVQIHIGTHQAAGASIYGRA